MGEFCPGASSFKQPTPETIKCKHCGAELEIWTDELKAVCPKCKKSVLKDAETSCIEWCKYAKQCVGEAIYGEYMQNKSAANKRKLLKELEDYFGRDKKRINHAIKVMQYAEGLLKIEKADWHIVIPASILHDVGIKAAEEKHGSSDGKYQEKLGPEIAKKILLKIGFKKEEIEEICEIIAHHHSPGAVDTMNFKVLYDADMLVNLKDIADTKDKGGLKKIIEKSFLTRAGRKAAGRVYLS